MQRCQSLTDVQVLVQDRAGIAREPSRAGAVIRHLEWAAARATFQTFSVAQRLQASTVLVLFFLCPCPLSRLRMFAKTRISRWNGNSQRKRKRMQRTSASTHRVVMRPATGKPRVRSKGNQSLSLTEGEDQDKVWRYPKGRAAALNVAPSQTA